MIDTQPAANPLDIPSPLPSEIVRNWPESMWGADNAKRIGTDGHVSFCAIGILAETGGFKWGEAPILCSGARLWRGFTRSPASRFVADEYGLSDDQIISLYDHNDLRGKDAAADYLESLGL